MSVFIIDVLVRVFGTFCFSPIYYLGIVNAKNNTIIIVMLSVVSL